MENLSNNRSTEQTATPESTGETTFDDLEKAVPFNNTSTESIQPIPTDDEKNATLSALRQQLKETYQDKPSVEVDISTPENDTEDSGIVPRERSKFDLAGKLRDRTDIRTITDLILDSAEHPENQASNSAIAQKMLNPYIANSVIDICIEEIATDNPTPFELLNNFSADTIKQKFYDSGASGDAIIKSAKDCLTGKIQNVITDITVNQITNNPKFFSDNQPSTSNDFKYLSDKNREKIFNAFRGIGNLDTAVQLITPDIGQKYREELAPQLNTPFRLAHAIQKGNLDELAPPDFVDTVKASISSDSNEALQLFKFKFFDSVDAVTTLGPELVNKFIDDGTATDTFFISYESYPPTTEAAANSIKSAYNSLKSHNLDFDTNFAIYLSKYPEAADIITTMENYSTEEIKSLNYAAKNNIPIKNISDLQNIDILAHGSMESWFQFEDQEYKRQDEYYYKDLLSEPGFNKKEIQQMQQEYEASKLAYYADHICQYFFGYNSREISALLSVDASQLNPDSKFQSVVSLTNNLLACKSVEEFKNFYQQSKNLVRPEELQPIFDQIKTEYLSQTAANYNKKLLSEDKISALGIKPQSIPYQNHEIPVYPIDGQDFTILIHKLGAYGQTDLSDPSVWDTRTTGNPYISTSLIGNKCLHLAGGTDKNTLAQGIFYGFSQLEPHAILAMSQQDLATYQKTNADGIYQKNTNDIRTIRKEVWYQNPDELLDATLKSTWGDDYSHNEVVLDRYSENGNRIHPNCIIVFGTNTNQISQDSLKHADYFNVPIYLINDKKCQKHSRKGVFA